MSEQTVTPVTTNDDTPNATPKAKRTAKRIEHNTLIRAFAVAKGIDEVSAGKQVRSRLRSKFAVIVKNDATNYGTKGKIKREYNDRTPWGTHSPATVKALFPDVPAAAFVKANAKSKRAK